MATVYLFGVDGCFEAHERTKGGRSSPPSTTVAEK